MSRRAVFLDRDGTLNRERDFVTAPGQLEVLPGTLDALRRLRAAGFLLPVVTNQSGVARGLYDERDLARIHENLHSLLERLPDGYFHCPHHPDQAGRPYGVPCDCRKPAPGLIHEAAELLELSLPGSYVVGDSARDLLMVRGLPVRTVLVQSGKPWREQLEQLRQQGVTPDFVAVDLAAAADWILAQGAAD